MADDLDDQTIMSVAEAREIMSRTTHDMTDTEVVDLVNSLRLLASAFIKAVQKSNKFRVNIAYNRDEKLE